MTTGTNEQRIVRDRVKELIGDFNSLQYEVRWGLPKYPDTEFPGQFRFRGYFGEESELHLYFFPTTVLRRRDLEGIPVRVLTFRVGRGLEFVDSGLLNEEAKISFSFSWKAGDYVLFFLGPDSRRLGEEAVASRRGF